MMFVYSSRFTTVWYQIKQIHVDKIKKDIIRLTKWLIMVISLYKRDNTAVCVSREVLGL